MLTRSLLFEPAFHIYGCLRGTEPRYLLESSGIVAPFKVVSAVKTVQMRKHFLISRPYCAATFPPARIRTLYVFKVFPDPQVNGG